MSEAITSDQRINIFGDTEIENPMVNLRWYRSIHNGEMQEPVLQQRWRVEVIKADRSDRHFREEWRDVPEEKPDAYYY